MADRPGDRQHGEPARDDVPPHAGIFSEPALLRHSVALATALRRAHSDVGCACSCAYPLYARVSTRARLRLRARVCVHVCGRVASAAAMPAWVTASPCPHGLLRRKLSLRRSLFEATRSIWHAARKPGCCATCNISTRSVCNAQQATLTRADSAARGGLLYRSAHDRVTYYARPVPVQILHAGRPAPRARIGAANRTRTRTRSHIRRR